MTTQTYIQTLQIDLRTYNIDTGAPIIINPYVDKNIKFSMELVDDKRTYTDTISSTEKSMINKKIINTTNKNNNDQEKEINNTFLQPFFLTSKEDDYKKI